MRFFTTSSLRTFTTALIAFVIIAVVYLATSLPVGAQANPSCSVTATPSSVERGETSTLSFSFSSMPPGGTITGAQLSNSPNSFTVPVQVIGGTTFGGLVISPTHASTDYTLTVDFTFAEGGIASLNCSTSVTVVDPAPAPVPAEPAAEDCEPYDCGALPPPPTEECDPNLPEEYGGCPPASEPTTPPATDTFPHNNWTITDGAGNTQAGTVCALGCTPGSTAPLCTFAACNDSQPGFACGNPGASYNTSYSNLFCADAGGTNCACWNPTYNDPAKPRDQFNVGGYGTGTGSGGTGGSGGSPSTVTPLSSPVVTQEGFPWPVRPAGEAGFDSFSGFVLLLLDLIGYLVFFLMAVAFVIFLWGIVQAWVLGAGNEQSVEKGKQFALAGIIGFVVVFSLWGIIALLQATFFG